MAKVVVVGSGIAGLIAAHRASSRHEVVLVTKSSIGEATTRYAQGGMAVAMFPDDSVAAHIADTLAAGAGLSDLRAVEALCGDGPERVRELIALGVDFDTVDGAVGGELARGHEAAHSARRVLHAGGDATGLAIELALVRTVRRLDLETYENTFLDEILVERGRVAGIAAIDATGHPIVIDADAVILASGGAGQLYRHTTNPLVSTGDGVAAAFRAGAALGELEFVQFHPTALAVAGTPLVSEAVRGEGAVLLDASGRRFMLDIHPDAELAPRDVVASGIAAAMSRQDGAPVLLDATALGAAFLAERFPGIDLVTREHGFDWSREPIPVTPAAHYSMGGVRTDRWGRTTLPGLLAAGEVATTGAHGANRLASNSLLESLVFASRAADALDATAVAAPPPSPFPERVDLTADPRQSVGEFSRPALQELMWDHVGLSRDATGLGEAIGILRGWRATGDSVADRENANLLMLGELVARAALRREESRGAHRRTDFPEPRVEWEHQTSWIAQPSASSPTHAAREPRRRPVPVIA